MSLVKHNNNSISEVTSMANLSSGAMTLIKEITASSDASISFVDGSSDVVLDSTYPIYKFEFINLHPQTNAVNVTFNLSTDSGSNYNVTKTTTYFTAEHAENDSGTGLSYNTSLDLAQSTAYQVFNDNTGADADQSVSGELYLFSPSSTTFVKHFFTNTNTGASNNYTYNIRTAGYCNTTSAVDAVDFKFNTGNIDSGKIKLYGIKDS